MELRVPFMYDAEAVSDQTGLMCLDDSLTNQAERDECDINTLVKRFGITGEVPVLDKLPLVGEFAEITDYHTAMNKLIETDELFMTIPADIRARFDHNAGKFVDFCSDEKNRDELIKMGLVVPAVIPPAPEPMLVKVVPDKV